MVPATVFLAGTLGPPDCSQQFRGRATSIEVSGGLELADSKESKSKIPAVVIAYGSFRDAIIQLVREGKVRDVSAVETAMDQLTSVLDEELEPDTIMDGPH